jgi:hypothetical protein
MEKSPFSPEEIELAVSLNRRGLAWKPKSADWFIDLSNLRVNYSGEYVQSLSLCLVIDEDGRSISFYELLIDGEENGNRMKRSLSYNKTDTFAMLNWVPDISDCISLIEKNGNYSFLNLEKKESFFMVSILNKAVNEIITEAGKTERIAFYKLLMMM